MFLFFHDIGFPWWAALAMLVIIIFSLLLTLRGLYVLVSKKPKRTLTYLGTVFGVFSIVWLTLLLTNSDVIQAICICFGLPFGFLAGMPFLLFVEPPESMMYLGATLLNLIAIGGIVEFIGKIFNLKRFR